MAIFMTVIQYDLKNLSTTYDSEIRTFSCDTNPSQHISGGGDITGHKTVLTVRTALASLHIGGILRPARSNLPNFARFFR